MNIDINEELSKFIIYILKGKDSYEKADLLNDIEMVNGMFITGYNEQLFNAIYKKYEISINYFESFKIKRNNNNDNSNINNYTRIIVLKYYLILIGLIKYVIEIGEDKLIELLNCNSNTDLILKLNNFLNN